MGATSRGNRNGVGGDRQKQQQVGGRGGETVIVTGAEGAAPLSLLPPNIPFPALPPRWSSAEAATWMGIIADGELLLYCNQRCFVHHLAALAGQMYFVPSGHPMSKLRS